jgi:membrane protein implicated in regulation of membrane protease activity
VRKALRWQGAPAPRKLPRRPFRDSAVLYGAMAAVLVVVAALTGGSVYRALVVGGFFFVVATAWSWRRWRERLREEERRQT